MIGAWNGHRRTTTLSLRYSGLEQAAREFNNVRRAYSDLNVLALGGTIAWIASYTFLVLVF